MNFSPNGTSKHSPSDAFAYAYMSVGLGGMLANSFILIVLLRDVKFLKQSAIIAGIALSHFLCALAVGASGAYRVVNMAKLEDPTTAWSCITKVYPATLPFAFQSMGVVLVLAGVERFVVFMFPQWYRINWTRRACWGVVGAAYACVSLSFCVGLYIAWYQPMTKLFCGYMTIFGKPYFVYSSSISAAGGTVAAGMTLTGLAIGMRQAKAVALAEASRYKRQIKLTRSMLSVAVCDVCLVVVPNIIVILSIVDPNLFPKLKSGNLSNVTNVTYCINTLTSLGSYLAFNRQFRNASKNALYCKKKLAWTVTAVRPLSCSDTKKATTTMPKSNYYTGVTGLGLTPIPRHAISQAPVS